MILFYLQAILKEKRGLIPFDGKQFQYNSQAYPKRLC